MSCSCNVGFYGTCFMFFIFETWLHFDNEYHNKLDVIQQNISEKKQQILNIESMEFPFATIIYTKTTSARDHPKGSLKSL